MPATLAERFQAKVNLDGPLAPGLATPCHQWIAAKSSEGYGNFGVAGRTLGAHRIAYELYVGPIPEGLQIDHLCRNHACVNPNHLEAVTQTENIKRGRAWDFNRSKRVCKRGHPLEGDNVRVYAGRRHCLECRRLHSQQRRRPELAKG